MKTSLRKEGYKGFKSYCSYLVNKSVADAVNKHHRPKKELRDEGLLSEAAISQLPKLMSIHLITKVTLEYTMEDQIQKKALL